MKLVASAARKTHIAVCAGKTLLRRGLSGFVECALSWGLVADPGAAKANGRFAKPPQPAVDATMAVLVYELLDAHADTAHLAGELECDPHWAAHLDYLRVLQRKGREALAHSTAETSRPERAAR